VAEGVVEQVANDDASITLIHAHDQPADGFDPHQTRVASVDGYRSAPCLIRTAQPRRGHRHSKRSRWPVPAAAAIHREFVRVQETAMAVSTVPDHSLLVRGRLAADLEEHPEFGDRCAEFMACGCG